MKYTWSAPEVIQTSSMDCGPACLKSLLKGLNISVNYGRLREACKTDIDGTSIDTLEELACELGLDAQQVLVPLQHLSLPEAKTMPAIVISQLPNNMTHFIVIWRRVGSWVQIMDPASGRHWVRWEKLKQKVYQHTMSLPINVWLSWTCGNEYRDALRRRLLLLGLSLSLADTYMEKFLPQVIGESVDMDMSHWAWRSVASFDAVVSWTQALIMAGALKKGEEVRHFIALQMQREQESAEPVGKVIPLQYWWVFPCEQDDTSVAVKAAVLVRVLGVNDLVVDDAMGFTDSESSSDSDVSVDDLQHEPASRSSGVSALLAANFQQQETNPWWLLYRLLLPNQQFMLRWFVPLIFFSAAAVTLQALLFQGLLTMNDFLGERQFSALIPMLLLFIVSSVLLEIAVARGALALGRQVEMQFRIALLNKIPRIHDPYFRSRLLTDMANRSHKLYVLRVFPTYLVSLLRQGSLVLFTLIGIWWLDTVAGVVASLMAVLLIVAIVFWQTLLSELEARAEVQDGVINLLYYDTLKGLTSIRSHAAQATVQTEQEAQLAQWARTQKALKNKHMSALLLLDLMALLCVAGLMFGKSMNAESFVPNFLWLYWLLRLPYLVKQLGMLLLALPPYKVVLARYAELLDATEVEADVKPELAAKIAGDDVSGAEQNATGIAIEFNQVELNTAGHRVLQDINLRIAAGEHIAVVGESGAGKTSLCELLLGWQSPSSGSLCVDGEVLAGAALLRLRQQTAWVDANVHLWDRSLLDNLNYDHGKGSVSEAGLGQVLANLPDGLQSPLGEGGKCLSGGEGQRVRIARALGVEKARLVILDEPCRGLDRHARENMLDSLRTRHAAATMLCITHDIGEAIKFPYVIVMGQGKILEQGNPEDLLAFDDSALSILYRNEQLLLQTLMTRSNWQSLHMVNGQLVAGHGALQYEEKSPVLSSSNATDADEVSHA